MAESDNVFADLIPAIHAIYDPRSSNETRKQATIFLEEAKVLPQAAARGFTLASDISQPPQTRHFGLGLIDYNVKYRWEELHEQDADAMKSMVIKLGQNIRDDEPTYMRNKVAQLWVDLAEKIWPESWIDLDASLLEFWQASFAHQMMVLNILQLLSESVFVRVDQGDGPSGNTLGKACAEIFAPSQALADLSRPRTDLSVRAGEEGWLFRILERLTWSCSNIGSDPRAKIYTIQLLATIQSIVPCMRLEVFSLTKYNETLGACLQIGDVEIRIATIDALFTLLSRISIKEVKDEEIVDVVCPLASRDYLKLLQDLFVFCEISVQEVDDDKYRLRKLLSEFVCKLAEFLEQRPQIILDHVDLNTLLDLVQHIFLDPSLVVSVPALYRSLRLLSSNYPPILEAMSQRYSRYLDACSSRVLRFGNLPDDSVDTTFRFLMVDFDELPERHAFVGNYRRMCLEMIEQIVRTSPTEAVYHFLGQTSSFLDALTSNGEPVDLANYKSDSYVALRVDAQCIVVTRSVHSYCKWLSELRARDDSDSNAQAQTQLNFSQWCYENQNKSFQDPVVQKRVSQMVVEVILETNPTDASVPLSAFRATFAKLFTGQIGPNLYGEQLKETNFAFARLLQKLVMRFPDTFVDSYTELEAIIQPVLSAHEVERRLKQDLRAVLFLVLQRARKIPYNEQIDRMSEIINVLIGPWQEPSFTQAASSFEAFCRLLGLDKMPDYFLSRHAHEIEDWSSVSLDQQGLDMRQDIMNRIESLPLQFTRSILAASTDKVRRGTHEHGIAADMWDRCIPIILPTLVPLIGHAHAFSKPSQWSGFSDTMQSIIPRILMDRIWQAGISSESRDGFYARVRDSRMTLEGLASAIRGSVRSVREIAYWILHCFAQFDNALYKHEDLAEPLAQAMYENAQELTSHQVCTLIQISRTLVEDCPVPRRQGFLPPLLTELFTKVDLKLDFEWRKMSVRETSEMDEETLDQQMKAESVLRELSFSAVSLVCKLLQPAGLPKKIETNSSGLAKSMDPLSLVIYQNPRVLSSIMPFCSHVIRMRDTRSCNKVIHLLLGLVSQLNTELMQCTQQVTQELREFFASDVLKSAISSFHEPYFADLQLDLATMISEILMACEGFTDTPFQTVLELPEMSSSNARQAFINVKKAKALRARGKIMLKLLENLRGVGVHELGKISTPSSNRRRKTIQEQYTKMDDDTPRIQRGGSPESGAMTDLFG